MKPLDIEDVLRVEIGELVEAHCMASPIPPDIETPCHVFIRTGGATSSLVADEHAVMVHTYADSWPEAVELADECVAAIKQAPFTGGLLNATYINTLPYNNYDQRHGDLARVSFAILAQARSERGRT